VSALGIYVLLALAPVAAFLAARAAVERLVLGRPAGPSGQPSVAGGRPLDLLVADLGRLERDYQRISRSAEPGRVSRLRAVGLAYDDTLRACCLRVGLPVPEGSPLGAVHRLETEAALAQRGVTW
jgi:hypothetical protein